MATTALIGAYGESYRGTDSGAAYVYIRQGDSWFFQAKLKAESPWVLAMLPRSVTLVVQ